jgi:hypothetical protein
MASTFSDLKFELIGTGDQAGNWGQTTNDNIGTAIEQAITGLGNPVFTTDANLTIGLTDTVALQTARALVLNVTSTGSLTATRELVVPTIEKQYIVQNSTSGAQSITVKTFAGTGITVPNGAKMHLYVNGVNVVDAVSHFSALTLSAALPVTSGGTGTTTPGLVAGTNVTISGTWPNQTVNSTASGTGDVVGPASATDSSLAAFDGTTGKLIKQAGVVTVAQGGTGTATPALVAGSNVTITGTWPNQTIASTGGGAGGGDLLENAQTIATDFTVTAAKNALAVGPVTINSGISVTVGSGQKWLVLN